MKRKTGILIFVGVMLTSVCAALSYDGFFEPFEVKVYDYFCRQRPASDDISSYLTLVEIDEESVHDIGKWPWPRRRQAELIEKVAAAGAKVIGVDVMYIESSPDSLDDELMVSAIKKAGNVYLDSQILTSVQVVDSAIDPASSLNYKYQLPNPAFAAVARGVGIVNTDFAHDNVDGIVRKLPVAKYIDGKYIPSLSLALVCAQLDTEPRYLPDGTIRLESQGYTIPTYPSRFRSGAGTISVLPGPRYDRSTYINYDPNLPQGNVPTLSARSILLGDRADYEAFIKNRIVLIGTTLSATDLYLTPYGTSLHGVRIQANLIRNILNKKLFRRVSKAAVALSVVLCGAASIYITISFSALPALLIVFGGLVLYCLASYRLFLEPYLYILDVVPVVLVGVLVSMVLELLELSMDLRKRMRNLEALHEYGKLFNSILALNDLSELVLNKYIELTGADGALLVTEVEGPEQMEIDFEGEVPDWLTLALGKKSNQREILAELSRDARNVAMEDLVGVEYERFGSEQVVFSPLVFHDGATGWITLVGEKISPALLAPEEKDYWLALSSIVRNALENARLYKLATVDGLTALYVRHFFDIAIEREFSRATRYKAELALLITDVDHFKKFNDTYGHQMGDRVLRLVAREVKSCVRTVDIPARYGGEEFAVILPETDRKGAELTAERIRRRIEELSIEHHGEIVRVTISIGVSIIKNSVARKAKDFIDEADEALYAAKEAGRNRVRIYAPEGIQKPGEGLFFEEELAK